MNFLLRASYAAAGHVAKLGANVLPAGSPNKLLRAITARRGLVERIERWAGVQRDASRPLLWIHAPSVGEGLQAKPVVLWMRDQVPRVQIVYTFFSPSAEKFASTLPVDFADYLPFDVATDVNRALRALRPSALVFSKLDVWPELVRQAAGRGVPLGMVSATVAAGSSRLGALSSALLHDAYAAFARVGAVSEADAERLKSLGVRSKALNVTGDTRYDQVWARVQDAASSALVPALLSERATLVAGSTWPSDEAVLLPAWAAVAREQRSARLIIAPHEPTEAHLEPIERWARAERLHLSRLDTPGAPTADVVLVDRVGALGDLYALATAAYVGGGFHAAGLHSVLEPAAFGAPVLFGPHHHSARDAALLLNVGGARCVSGEWPLAVAVKQWLFDRAARETAGSRARAFVKSGLGATEKSGQLVAELLALS